MLSRWRRWRAERFKARHPFPEPDWREACSRLPLLAALPADQAERLGSRAWQFVHDKRLSLHPELAGDLFDGPARLAIAAQACLLTLGWSDRDHRDALANVHEIVILPDAFRRDVEEVDEAGVVHAFADERAGETSHQGPVILAYPELMQSGGCDGFNVVIHEFAHKLDMGNSLDADGFPPLPADMSPHDWYREFMAVYNDLHQHLAAGQAPPIDDYAASHPGECFAVCCETFFSAPDRLASAYPGLYALLTRYFRQQPGRWPGHADGCAQGTGEESLAPGDVSGDDGERP